MMKRTVVTASDRIDKLSSPFLAELEGIRRSLMRKGRTIADLGRLSLNIAPTAGTGLPQECSSGKIKEVFADYLFHAHDIRINPDREMLLLPAGRTAMLLLGLYFLEPNRTCYLPDPGYDSYRNIAVLFKAHIKKYSLYQRNDFLPNLAGFAEKKRRKAFKVLVLNSPHNPTGAICDRALYDQLERTAAQENILVLVDSAYCLNSPGRFQPPLYCDSRKRRKTGLELFSFSTNLCAPDLKLSILVGRRELIAGLENLAKHTGIVPSQPALEKAGEYFTSVDILADHLKRCRQELATRVEMMQKVLSAAKIEYFPLISTPFVWVKLKPGRVSLTFARGLLRRRGVIVTPGSAFGEHGEGWVRLAANLSGDDLEAAMAEFVRHYQPLRTRLQSRRRT